MGLEYIPVHCWERMKSSNGAAAAACALFLWHSAALLVSCILCCSFLTDFRILEQQARQKQVTSGACNVSLSLASHWLATYSCLPSALRCWQLVNMESSVDAAELELQQQHQRQQQRLVEEQHASSEDKHEARPAHAAAAGASSSSASSAAQLLHRDGLTSIFAFLPFCNLAAVTAVCRSWKCALIKQPARAFQAECTRAQLQWLSVSVLGKLVDSLLLMDPLDVGDILLLQRLERVASLTAIPDTESFWGLAVAGGDAPLATAKFLKFPANITHMQLRKFGRATQQEQSLFMSMVAGCAKLESFSLELCSHPDEGYTRPTMLELGPLQLAPLQNLQLLRLEHVDKLLCRRLAMQLAGLHALKILNVDSGRGWTAQLLHHLTDPLYCKLQQLCHLEMEQTRDVAAQHIRVLQRLPALTELHSRYMLDDAPPQLVSLLALKRVHVASSATDFVTRQPASQLVPHLAACTRLSHVAIYFCVFTDDDLDQLTNALPELCELGLSSCNLPLLDTLQQAKQLRALSINLCDLRIIHLPPLVQCEQLRGLTVQLPAEEHEVARMLLTDSFKHLESFEILP